MTAVTIREVLINAQRTLAGDQKHGPGWTGPEHVMGYCMGVFGRSALGLQMLEPCAWDDERVWQYTVEGALRAAANGESSLVFAAWEMLRSVVSPSIVAEEHFHAALPPLSQESWPQYKLWSVMAKVASTQQDLDDWLRDPSRTLKEVLAAFDTTLIKLRAVS